MGMAKGFIDSWALSQGGPGYYTCKHSSRRDIYQCMHKCQQGMATIVHQSNPDGGYLPSCFIEEIRFCYCKRVDHAYEGLMTTTQWNNLQEQSRALYPKKRVSRERRMRGTARKARICESAVIREDSLQFVGSSVNDCRKSGQGKAAVVIEDLVEFVVPEPLTEVTIEPVQVVVPPAVSECVAPGIVLLAELASPN